MIHSVEPAPATTPRRRRSRKRIHPCRSRRRLRARDVRVFLPQIADYRDVWAVVKGLSWEWLVALAAATLLNLATFAPPWQAALPGLSFLSAFVLTQVSTALSLVVPGGAAVGIAGAYGILRRWGFRGRDIGRGVTLVSLWNQFANLSYPVVAVFLLAVEGSSSAVLATAAFVGAAVLGIAVAALGAVLASRRAASGIGELAAQLTDWGLGKFGRRAGRLGRGELRAVPPRGRGSAPATLARADARDLRGTLSVFLVFLVSLRAFDVPASEVTVIEAFAAWALARLLGTIPITPGGIGVVELSLTATLVGFGGSNAGVVAAVLVYRFLTMVPTIVVGLAATPYLNRRARRETVSVEAEH